MPASVSGMGAGGNGSQNLSQAVHSVARPGTSRIPAKTLPSRARRAPGKPEQYKQVDRGVFQEIDAVGEQRHRADRRRDGEFHAEIAEVERGNQPDGLSQASRHVEPAHLFGY